VFSSYLLDGTGGGKTLFAVTGGKTLTLTATDDFNLTIPATGTFALLESANVFTNIQKINVNSTAGFLVEQTGVKSNVVVVDTANGYIGFNTASAPVSTLHIGASTAVTISTPWSLTYQHYMSAWGTNITRPYFVKAYNATYGNFLYISSTGNSANTNTNAMILGDNNTGIFFGKGSTDGQSVSLTYGGFSYATGHCGIGLWPVLAAARLHVVTNTTVTNAALEIERIEARVSTASTGSSAGFGPALTWYGESATDANYNQMGQFEYTWATATTATRKARGVIYVYDTAQREAIRVEASGSAAMIGLFGVAAVAQPAGAAQVAPAAYATGAYGLDSDAHMQALYDLVVAMRLALVNLGIIKGAA
jgi:hypothetical protein